MQLLRASIRTRYRTTQWKGRRSRAAPRGPRARGGLPVGAVAAGAGLHPAVAAGGVPRRGRRGARQEGPPSSLRMPQHREMSVGVSAWGGSGAG